MSQGQINFDVTRSEALLIGEIVKRGMEIAKKAGRRDIKAMDMHMDITACHANGCPLKLQELADADDFNLAHDVFGISGHIDRDTGKLTDCFRPRFAA
jgi:hypothetical protein